MTHRPSPSLRAGTGRAGTGRAGTGRAGTAPRGWRTDWSYADEPLAPPVLVGARYDDARRRFTDRHAELLRDPSLAHGTGWSAVALWSCLDHLRVSTVTHAAQVAVVDAWTDGADALCVVYHPPADAGRVVGVRRRRQDAVEALEWRIGDMTTWGYDLRSDDHPDGVDPVAFGWNVADFDLGEPLGFVATVLRHDRGDVGWWGNLDDDLPHAP